MQRDFASRDFRHGFLRSHGMRFVSSVGNITVIVFLLMIPLLVSCNGGGGGQQGGSEEIPCILEWEQQFLFADNSVLNPLTDIERYDIYMNDIGFFDEEIDEPIASVAAVEDVLIDETYVTQPTWHFDLARLEPFGIGPGHWVSVRSVGLDNVASEFSEPVLWGTINQKGET
jgi:hypothetical protein